VLATFEDHQRSHQRHIQLPRVRHDDNVFFVWQPSAVTGTSAFVASESIDLWKDYLRFHLIEHYASVLPKALASEDFAFYGVIVAGSQ
jgi:predicted metalloendopeptidase